MKGKTEWVNVGQAYATHPFGIEEANTRFGDLESKHARLGGQKLGATGIFLTLLGRSWKKKL